MPVCVLISVIVGHKLGVMTMDIVIVVSVAVEIPVIEALL